MSVVRGSLIGRDSELRLLGAAVRAAARGTAQIAGIAGEPGIGKTRLLGELATLAAAHGLRVLSGRAAEFEREVPFALVVDALDDAVRDSGRLGGLDERERRLAGEIFPALRTGAGFPRPPQPRTPMAGRALQRYHHFRALRSMLEHLAAPGGLALLLDDVHWADPTSVELVEHLLRHPPAGPILIALGYRPAQVPPRLAAALAQGHQDRTHLVSLGPLTGSEAARLLGPDIEPAQAVRLHRISGGNPMYLEALRRTGPAPGAAIRTMDDLDAGLSMLPAEVRAALAAEIEAVTPRARLVASAAAVCGHESEPTVLAAVAETTTAHVLDGLDELAARDVLQAVSTTGRFRFRHPLVRHVVYASSAAGWRLGAHARAAGYLARVGAPASARAHHVARAAVPGDAEAAATLIDAARAVGAQAPATAVEWLQAGLRLLPDGQLAGLPTRLDLLAELARRQGASGYLSDARATMRSVLELMPREGPLNRANAVAYTAVLDRLLGRHADARALLGAAIADVGPQDAPHLMLQLATCGILTGELAEADAMLCEVIAAEPGSPHALIAEALRPMTGFATGAVPEGTPPSASTLFDTLADADIAREIDIFAWLCWTELYAVGPRESLRHLVRCRQIAVAAGHSFVLPYVLAATAFVQARLGRVTEGLAAAAEAVDLSRLLGAAEPLALGLLTQAWLLRCAGEHAAAVTAGRQAVAAAEECQGWRATAGAMLAFAQIGAGDLAAGRAGFAEAGGGPDLPWLFPHNRLIACTVLSEAATAEGDAAGAASWAALAESIGDPGREVGPGLAKLARAYAVSLADPAAAAVLAEEAAEILVRAELLLEAGRCWLLAGRAHLRAGDRDAAKDVLNIAVRLFDGTGAGAWLPELGELLRQSGMRMGASGPAGVTGAATLTPREAEIAAMLAEGGSNAAIAAQLFLSVRTVDTHLSRIYSKLGVTSRAAAVTLLARHGDGSEVR
jgi:DNA-binding CsgD family transcriptional regulator